MVCGNVAAQPPARPVQVMFPAIPEEIRSAYEIDLATLALRDAQLTRTSQGASVVVAAGFSAVLLPTPDCPPLLQADEMRPINRGQTAELKLTAFAPWRNDAAQVCATVFAPGLCSSPVSVTLPSTLHLSAPPTTEPGWYPLTLTGNCLPRKRWVRVEP